MMEAAITPEMTINFYRATRCNNPEDGHLQKHCRENLSSYKVIPK
jgi:hypothetical protein